MCSIFLKKKAHKLLKSKRIFLKIIVLFSNQGNQAIPNMRYAWPLKFKTLSPLSWKKFLCQKSVYELFLHCKIKKTMA